VNTKVLSSREEGTRVKDRQEKAGNLAKWSGRQVSHVGTNQADSWNCCYCPGNSRHLYDLLSPPELLSCSRQLLQGNAKLIWPTWIWIVQPDPWTYHLLLEQHCKTYFYSHFLQLKTFRPQYHNKGPFLNITSFLKCPSNEYILS
jgi:hypothetical protein